MRPGADQLLARSVDGMTIGTPMAALLDGREPLLCVGHERRAAAAGARLPRAHAHPRPLRLRRRLQVARASWRPTTFADVDAYWVERGWAPQGTVKTASRIDRPAPFAPLDARRRAGRRGGLGPGPRDPGRRGAGRRRRRGSRRPCCPCRRSTPGCSGATTGPATPGSHSLSVRATDGTGAVQPEERVDAVPGRRHRLAHDHGVGRLARPATAQLAASTCCSRRAPRSTSAPNTSPSTDHSTTCTPSAAIRKS